MLTALLLTRNGIKTRIIDQESRTTGHSYCCALHPQSIEFLQQVGIADEAIHFGRRIKTVAFYEKNERRAEIKLSTLPAIYPFALVMDQGALEKLLEQKLRQSDIRVQWNQRLAGFEMGDSGTTATVEGLSMTGKGYGVPDFEMGVDKVRKARADFIVGADGTNSLVRAKMGIPFERVGAPQHFEVYEIEVGEPCGEEVRVVLGDSSSGVLWPLSETRCRWSFQVSPVAEGEDFPQKERDRLVIVEPPSEQDHLHRLNQLLWEHAPWFKNPVREVVWSAQVQFEPRLVRHFGRKFCWLVGDAGHQTGPIGMQSMNMGFREAADLARVLTEILRKGGSHDLLKEYDRTRYSEWVHLMGFRPGAIPFEQASEWVTAADGTDCGQPARHGTRLGGSLETGRSQFSIAHSPMPKNGWHLPIRG